MADFSDQSGQFSASCFEESLVPQFQEWARSGECVLLTVELDRPSADEPPRVTVRGARALSAVTGSARMELRLTVDRVEAIGELALALPRGEGATGEVIARLLLGEGREATMLLGRDFALDGELVDRIAAIAGVTGAALSARNRGSAPRLAA